MVVKLVPRSCEIAAANGKVEQAVPVFLGIIVLAREVAMIHPYMMRITAGNGIRVGIKDSEVADDDILLAIDVQTNAIECGICACSHNGFIGTYGDDILFSVHSRALQFALEYHHSGDVVADVACKVGTVVHPYHTTSISSSDSVAHIVIVGKAHQSAPLMASRRFCHLSLL